MSVLRFFSVFFVAFLLLNLFLKTIQNETQKPTILFAIDNSASIVAVSDSAFIKSEFLNSIDALKKDFSNKFTIKTVLFGDKTKASEEKPDFKEKETDLHQLLADVDNNYANENVGAMILISDGIYNKGSNPLYNLNLLQYPVYSIGLGDTNEIRDVAIQKINHNDFAYLGNIFPAEVMVNAKKFFGKEVTVSLIDPRGKKTEQKIKITSDAFLSGTTFTLNAETGGVQRYKVDVTVLEGEKNISNNHQTFAIEVIDNRSKILLLASYPHPDVIAIKEALQNNTSYEIEYLLSSERNVPVMPYSLVIIHGFSPAQTNIINECRNNNIPTWIVNPGTTENLSGVKISASNNKFNDSEPLLNNSFGLFTLSADLQKFIKDLPAIKTFFGNYSVNAGANSLITQKIGMVETENPVLLFTETNGQKNGVFIGDGLWRWKMRDFEEHKNTVLFNELINKTIQYLSIKSDKSFFRVSSPKIINENEVVELGAEVYNKTYELITDPEVNLILINSNKKQFNYTFSKTPNAYKLNLGFLPAGEYTYQAKVKLGNQVLTKSGNILVKEIVAEQLNTVANHQLLYQISYRTGGKFYSPKQLNTLHEDVLKNELIKPITYTTHSTNPLIDLKWLFYIIILLLVAEWFLRKTYTTI